MSFFTKVSKYARAHRAISGLTIVAVIGSIYGIHSHYASSTTVTKYVVTSVQKGTLIATVTGSGQVSATDQIDIKPKVSGDVITIKIKGGQQVKAGDILVQLNASDALKTLRDAQANLANAQLSLKKLQQPTEELTLLQAENSLAAAKESKSDAEDSLLKAYEDGYNAISNVFLDLPGIMQGLQSLLYGTEVGTAGQDNTSAYSDLVKNVDPDITRYQNEVTQKYTAARAAFDSNYTTYKTVSRASDNQTLINLLNQTYATTKLIADTVKSTNNFLDYFQDSASIHQVHVPSQLAGHQSNIDTYTSKTNSGLSSLLSNSTNIKNTKDAIINADRTIAERQASFTKTTSGPDDLDLATQRLTVQQRQNSLIDAQIALSNYTIRAPFDGMITKVTVKKYDTAGSGSAIATLITNQQIAQITLNEVDAAKVKAGQKVTLSFDAIDDLNITGQVAEVDSIGTVSQGVVSYTVKITFDTQDERVKPGMTVSASIITDLKTDALSVPNSAIKTVGENRYVEQLSGKQEESPLGIESATAPTRTIITTGLITDTNTEISNGLSEGDQIITRTITSQTKTTAASTAPSLFGGTGGTRTTGGNATFSAGAAVRTIQR